MPIPDFNHNLVLPPHLGDPRIPADLSPYPATPLEVCERFSTSLDRIDILEGWFALRQALRDHQVTTGFQWLDGSFTENIELLENRPPKDIDVVTYYNSPQNLLLGGTFPMTSTDAKAQFKVDHYLFDLNFSGEILVELTRRFCLLFSHNRNDVWKGMIRVDLCDAGTDQNALQYLEARKRELEQ